MEKGQRVQLDCAGYKRPKEQWPRGKVEEAGPQSSVVKWDNGITQAHPNSQLTKEEGP